MCYVFIMILHVCMSLYMLLLCCVDCVLYLCFLYVVVCPSSHFCISLVVLYGVIYFYVFYLLMSSRYLFMYFRVVVFLYFICFSVYVLFVSCSSLCVFVNCQCSCVCLFVIVIRRPFFFLLLFCS